ncbi:hypothetical protein QFC22_003100 [Naganishia vaughanmartiniae]|uniref:Uncharacterized protein n=1 Tax=Naganishia vaughanmartiniae TaxID=1424756 RepID=A0ACC2X9D1_9TREE|nr:hypothetical protein QFC22_003100 [Naganishia vaughanmartiniae]
MAVFALIYPFVSYPPFLSKAFQAYLLLRSPQLVIQALQARAVPALSLEDATTSLPLSPYTNGRPPSPFYSHQGSPIGTPITTSNGLPPLSPNGLNSSESVFAFPNEASDQIAARLQAYQQDSLLVGDDDYDGGRQFNGYRHTGAKDTLQQKDALKIAYRYLARAWVLVRHVPLFWIATSSQETMRWFILGIERRVGRSSGSSIFIQSDRRGSGAGMSNGGAYMGKKRNSSYK